MKLSIIIITTFALLKPVSSSAQLNVEQQKAIIDSLCVKLERYYIYPDVATKVVQFIHEQQANQVYAPITDENTFAGQVTADLRLAGNDQHLRLEYSENILPDQNDEPYVMTEDDKKEMEQFFLHQNYGIRKVEVLKGNIGLIDFSCICGADIAGEKYAAIMNYLSHTDALIIDLRSCRGAMGMDGISFLSSYFFDGSVHLNDLIWRKDNALEQKWTYACVPGKRYLDKPVYILTSARTFSGGEGFSYHLQALKRATIIGEQTRGGANPGASIKVSDHFSSFIPLGRTYNPITKSSWEGIGVTPDSLIKANRALYAAHQLALNHCIGQSEDSEWKANLENILTELNENPPAFKTVPFELKGYENAKEVFVTGTFNNWARKTIPLTRKGNIWSADVECEPGRIQYQFIVDEIPMLDPDNKLTVKEGEYTNSVKTLK
jgi:hypothetical protein